MSETGVGIERWSGEQPPTEAQLRGRLADEGLQAYRWSNAPRDVYGRHRHPYDKVIYVVQGSITFGLPELGQEAVLRAGDRLDLPRDTQHDAVVGPEGVTCLEAHAT